MVYRLLTALMIVGLPMVAWADYKPKTVEQAVEPDLVIAVDNHASMTYDWCGSYERNQVYGDGDRNPRFRGGRTLCRLGEGRSRLQHLRTALRKQFEAAEDLRMTLLRPGQNADLAQLAEASNYRYPAGTRGARQSLPMWGPEGSNNRCNSRNQCCWGRSISDFNRRDVRRNFISVDSQSIENNRGEFVSWVDAQGPVEMRGLGASNLQGMMMAARYVHQRNARRGAPADEQCRKHFTMLITDSWDHRGLSSCSTANNSVDQLRRTISGNRNRGLGAASSDTMVIGFGPHYLNTTARANLDELARVGGQAMHPTMPFVVNNSVGRAMYARTPEELENVLESAIQTAFSGEYQGGRAEVTTLWSAPSDVGRVVDNGILVPIVQQPGNRGRLYAYRLFHEDQPFSGEWTFRGDPSIRWDAGALLSTRTSYADRTGHATNRNPRKMFTGVEVRESNRAQVTWSTGALRRSSVEWPVPRRERMQWYRSFGIRCPLDAANDAPCWDVPDLNENGNPSDDYDRRVAMSRMIMKLRGARIDTTQPEARVGDEIVDQRHGFMDNDGAWKLGPLVHSSPVTPRYGRNTARQDTDPDYKSYAAVVGANPPMAYVGAGHLIHAFFLNASSADGFEPARVTHTAGEEAWSYLPRANHEHLRDVFTPDFAGFRGDKPSLMDGRCRAFEAKLDLPQAEERGGWSALLICPAVGARKVVVLDVSEPLSPQPVFEFGDRYLGEVHSTPAVGFVDVGGQQTKPVMIVASGVGNAQSRREFDCPKPWCRDLPAVMVVDLTTGRVMQRYVLNQLAGEGIMTDVSAIDHDGDGVLDLAYVGTTRGRMLTLDLHARGRPDGAAWALTERVGSDVALGMQPQVGAPMIDMRERNAARFNIIATAADVGGEGRPTRRGSMRVLTERQPNDPRSSTLNPGCNLMRARNARLGRDEYAVSAPVVSKGTAIYTTVQGGDGCEGSIQRMRCVDLDTCTETCNEVICDPRQSTCSSEPAPPTFLADGRLYYYDAGAGMLKTLGRVTDSGVEMTPAGGFADNTLPGTEPNQARPRNLIMHWREVY
jgi:hypothetical protein